MEILVLHPSNVAEIIDRAPYSTPEYRNVLRPGLPGEMPIIVTERIYQYRGRPVLPNPTVPEDWSIVVSSPDLRGIDLLVVDVVRFNV